MNKKILITIMMLALLLPATAQVRVGLRGGMTVDKLRFDRDIVSSDNRVGYTAGALVDIGIPVIGLGLEASAMFTHRNNRLTDGNRTFKRYYLDIPVYARFRLPITSLQHVFAPLVFTGPTFSVLFNDNAAINLNNHKTYLSWDAGLGADLFNHLRITATYGIGISKAMSYIDREYTGEKVSGKDRHWTLNAAWFF